MTSGRLEPRCTAAAATNLYSHSTVDVEFKWAVGQLSKAERNRVGGRSQAPAGWNACLLPGGCCKQRDGEAASKGLLKCVPYTVNSLEVQKCIPRLGV